jgi:hypothetical protein
MLPTEKKDSSGTDGRERLSHYRKREEYFSVPDRREIIHHHRSGELLPFFIQETLSLQ